MPSGYTAFHTSEHNGAALHPKVNSSCCVLWSSFLFLPQSPDTSPTAIQQDQVTAAETTQRINDLNSRVQKLENDNSLLHDQLAMVQEENYNLKGYNDVLKKALETAKLTGRVPQIMPYPPK